MSAGSQLGKSACGTICSYGLNYGFAVKLVYDNHPFFLILRSTVINTCQALHQVQ